nr:cyclic nucleotide-binding domain-containing protein [uncultured Gellertiella sp.]
MALNDDIKLLSSVPLFRGLNEDQLRLLTFGAERRALLTGMTLFRERSPAECAYVIASGSVELSTQTKSGKQQRDSVVGPGTLLSELALITLVERKFTAQAVDDCEVIRIPRPLFQRLIEEYPAVAAMVEDRIRNNITGLVGELSKLRSYFG